IVARKEVPMETWSIRDDERPAMRPEPPRTQWLWLAIGAVILAAMAAVYYYSLLDLRPAQPEPVAQPAAPAAAPAPVAAAAPEPAVRHPVPAEAEPSLPTLDNSDAMARESLAGLMGSEAFRDFVIPKEL